MAVVIRLQGLPVVAGSVDIRHFFSGLNIPDGGVHIIGGKAGDAFIIFATDEDARRAMSRTGGVIKNSHIQLFLSSKTEMQNTLELSRRSSQKHPAVPTGSDTFATRKGVNQNKFDKNMSDLGLDNSGMRHTETYSAKYDRREAKNSKVADDVYVHLSGLPYSVTEDDIRKFFSGLDVVEVIFLLRNGGLKTGNGLVKFGSVKDATAALSRHKQYIGARFIVVKMTTEEQWISAGGQVGLTHSKQPRKLRSRSRSPLNQQFYMHLKNLAYNVAKDDIRHFLGLLDLSDAQIKFLLDHNKKKTREGFVMVGSEWELERCMALHKTNLNGRPVFIYPIPRKTMLDLIESSEGQSTARVESFSGNYPQRDNSPIRRSLYLRNFPFDVTKGEVMRFLAGFPVREDDIVLLFDGRGVGLGEALVKFPTEEQALLAERLDRQQFLDTEVLLRRISDEQMKELGVFMDKPADRSPMYRDDYNVSEPVERSYPLLDDLNYGHGDFQERSPERFQRSNQLDFVGGDEYSGKYDPENQNIVDYHHSLPFRSQSLERKTWSAIVRMKNLPYKATMEEILDFFYGYNITHNSVRVKFNKNGMATGLATVYFENYDEAIAAVNELNERPIGTRKITLSVHKLKNV